MKYATGKAYFRRHSTYSIMVLRDKDSWDIYYADKGTDFRFAFGLPLATRLSRVFYVAERNIDLYMDILFDEGNEVYVSHN